MLKNILIQISDVFDPSFNLAYEESLLEETLPETIVLYLWQNENTIVIGRHQNPYKECNLIKVKEDHVNIVRRLSGGGAVYHDLGNLNFTFITDEETYDVSRQCSVIINALKEFGLFCEMSGRNDLTINGLKFSGNAFMNHDDTYCHHGTLLVNADINKLSNYLTISDLKIQFKGVDSVRARVVNLAQINKDITIERLKSALIQTFKAEYDMEAPIQIISPLNAKQSVIDKMKKYQTWDWNFSESPNFAIEHSKKFDWGIVDLRFNTENGIIVSCQISSDCLLDENFDLLQRHLISRPFHLESIKKITIECLRNTMVKEALCDWFDQLF